MAPKTKTKPEAGTRGGARAGAGRKTAAELGLEARPRRIMVRLTETEYALIEAAADAEGTTVAELVRERALGVEARP